MSEETAIESLAEIIVSIGEPLGLDVSKSGMLAKLWNKEYLSTPIEIIPESIKHRLASPEYALFLKPPAAPDPVPANPVGSHEEWATNFRANQEAARRGDLLRPAPEPAAPTPAPSAPDGDPFGTFAKEFRERHESRRPWEVKS